MKHSLKTLAGAALAAMLALQTPAFAHGDADESAEKIQSLIDDVRRATLPFHEVQAATTPSSNQWHGGAFQRAHQRLGQTNTLRFSR